MHDSFLAPALSPAGMSSETVRGVKSHCGSRMENADMQPASVLNTTHEDSRGPEEKPQSLISVMVREEKGRLLKGIQSKQNFVLQYASCVGWQ